MPLTRRHLLLAPPALWLARVDLRAADFWEKTPDYRDWSMEDVQDMLFKSPWVERVTLTPPGARAGGGGRPGGGLGGRAGGVGGAGGRQGGGAGGAGGPGGGFGGGGRPGGGPPQRPLYVRWQSARPIKEAISRARLGPEGGGELQPLQQDWLDAEGDHYVIAVSGLPPRMAGLAENAAGLAESAFLERKGKEPIQAARSEGSGNEQAVELYFLFPKLEPIVLADKQVVFNAVLNGPGQETEQRRRRGLPVKARFKTKDLLYRGELAL